jgi:hypothetical protein
MGAGRLDNQAGVDKVWDQRKLEASLSCWHCAPAHVANVQGKLLENAADSHLPKRSEGVHAVLGGLFA